MICFLTAATSNINKFESTSRGSEHEKKSFRFLAQVLTVPESRVLKLLAHLPSSRSSDISVGSQALLARDSSQIGPYQVCNTIEICM